jgi:sugar transferase EpsL
VPRRSHQRAKRVFDLFFATLALAVLSPVLTLVAILILVFIGRPVLFRQERPGLHGEPFTILKFRTMREDRDAAGRLLPDSKRLTRLGRFLRRTSLDELPELVNVIRGEMSLVGPRPLLMRYLDRYSPEQRRRHELKPGITGWTQLNGRNALTWEEKFRLDLWYVEHRSLLLDGRILIRTAWKVLTGEGVTPRHSEEVPEFLGDGAQGLDTGEGGAHG